MHDIDTVWNRLRSIKGEEFQTISGLPFTYKILGDVLRTSRTEYNLTKSDFGRALLMVPIDGPGAINNLVRGPSYVWALLHDPRVRQGAW